MTLNQKSTGRAVSIPAGVMIGGCCSVLCTVVGAAITAFLINREILGAQTIGYDCMVILVLASLLGSLVAWWKVKHRRIAVCLLSGGVYLLMLLGITALFFGGQYEAVSVTAFLVLAGSGTAALMGMGSGRGNRPYGRKIRR